MIELNDVTKKISESFELNVRNIIFQNENNYKIFGKNGSGKTVFLKTILGIICKDSGTIKKGKNTVSGFLGIERMVDFLTPKEYFYIVCKSYNIPKKEVLERYNSINRFFNRKYMDEKKQICNYSDGNKQLIGIMAACLPFCDFVLLDEPFNYLDNETSAALVQMINELSSNKKMSFIYSDNSDRLKVDNLKTVLIENGKVSQPS